MSKETTLIRRLTKINRMDIVHLIETKIMKSTLEDNSSHTYAEIEQTIALDHSEGTQVSAESGLMNKILFILED